MILNISHVASAEQSVNNDTSSGTLSTFSRCGRMFSMPLGSFALNFEVNNKYCDHRHYQTISFGSYPIGHIEIDCSTLFGAVGVAAQRMTIIVFIFHRRIFGDALLLISNRFNATVQTLVQQLFRHIFMNCIRCRGAPRFGQLQCAVAKQ